MRTLLISIGTFVYVGVNGRHGAQDACRQDALETTAEGLRPEGVTLPRGMDQEPSWHCRRHGSRCTYEGCFEDGEVQSVTVNVGSFACGFGGNALVLVPQGVHHSHRRLPWVVDVEDRLVGRRVATTR